MKEKRKEIILIILLIIQTIIFIYCGFKKSYIHMDEAYSLGLASYDKVEIQDNEDFYNTWHTKEYYEDYLSVRPDEIGEYNQVYENQKNDVHPPLYYLLLRFAMGFTRGNFSKWSGIFLNIIIFEFITILVYLILQELSDGKTNVKEKSIILAFISSITMASLTNVIYIRMYALSTLNILITTWLHLRLLKEDKINIKLLVLISISALVGSLTHYYYLFYLVIMYFIFAIKYIKNKQWKEMIYYTLGMACAGIVSLLVFPYSVQHMFFGYRGQGFISKLFNLPEFYKSIEQYVLKVNRFVFNNLLILIIFEILCIKLYKIIKKINQKVQINNNITIILIPMLFYFIIVAIASPWIELRYIMPICNVIFIIVIYYLYKLINTVFDEKKSSIFIAITLILLIISPIFFKIEPEVMYSDKKEIVEKLSNELNLPTLYIFNSAENRFLDDILLFSKLDNSYIAKDINCTAENINLIMDKKDTTNGMVVFINPGQDNDKILETIKNATGLEKINHLKRLNACDVYYINNIK